MIKSHRWTVKGTLLLALAALLLLAVPASADTPLIETGVLDLDYPMEPQICPGIEVWDHEVLTYRQMVFFDKDGSLKKIVLHFEGTDSFYNPDNSDVVLSGHFSATTEVDLQTGAYINARGLPVHIVIPGYGPALLRAGFWSAYPDEHVAGKDSLDDPDDIAAFCAYLTGN